MTEIKSEGCFTIGSNKTRSWTLKNQWRERLKWKFLSQEGLGWFDVRNSTSSRKWESGLLFSYEMVCRFIFVVCRLILIELFFIFLDFLIVPFLHFNRSVSTFVFSDELDWFAVLIFHSEIAQIRNQSVVLI